MNGIFGRWKENIWPSTLRRQRRVLFLSVLGLTLFGILMVYEASSVYAYHIASDPAYFLKRQFVFFLAGLAAFFLTIFFVDLDWLRQYYKEILGATLVLLALVLFLGKSAGGAKRWLSLGIVHVQPSEFLKISFVLFGAEYFRRKGKKIRSLREGVLPMMGVLAVIGVLSLLQPDLGTAIFWVIWVFLMLFLYKARIRHLSAVGGVGILLCALLIFASPYRMRRIVSYLNPFLDPQGAGFQLIQSQIAYGSGGLFGVGLGEGKQKLFFLPAAHTDFVYSIIAEEFGLLVSGGILFLFYFLFHHMYRIAVRCQDPFRRAVLWGVICVFFLEIILNIGVTCGVFPTKGMALPFLSYGGSNLITHYVLLGIFFNATRTNTPHNSLRM
ncbi:MAG: putative lipid II flippase FtsW [Candidatus Omnitrophica bacterium]|nr:putative lipid II flippase FtsW [Candidatus Omnitrophota bacterium]